MSILDKVRKLRALAQSSNVHEAAAAAAAAERLIQEYQIGEAEIPVTDAPQEECASTPSVLNDWGRVPQWESVLLATLRRLYHCSAIFDSATSTGRTRYIVFGRPYDVETLRYQYAWYTTEINRITLASSRGKGRTFANSFRLGAVHAICEALRDVQRSTRAAATSTALAVVDSRDDAAKRAMSVVYPRTKPRTLSAPRLHGGAYEQGQQAGKGISQRTALGNASGVRLLGR